jgi:ParB/RepB/Spo0J family partition protein
VRNSEEIYMGKEIIEIPLGKLVPDKKNPRFSMEEIEELADGIQKSGQKKPVDVEPKGKKYLVTDGHRRYKAFKVIKKRTKKEPKVKCIVKKKKTDAQRLEEQVVIDAQTKNLKRGERDPAWTKLWKAQKKKDEKEFAKLLGVRRETVKEFLDRMDLLKDKEIKKLNLPEDVIAETKGLKNQAMRKKLLQKAAKEDMGSRAVRKVVSAVREQTKTVQGAAISGSITPEQASKLKGLDESVQKDTIENMKATKKAINKIPEIVKRDVNGKAPKPKNEAEERKVSAQEFVDRLVTEVADTADQMRLVEAALDAINEQDLDQHFNAKMKKALAGVLKELSEDIEPTLKKVKANVKKWGR